MMVKEVPQRKVFFFHLKLYFMRQKKRKAKRHEFERSHVCYRKLYCSFGVGLGWVGLGWGWGLEGLQLALMIIDKYTSSIANYVYLSYAIGRKSYEHELITYSEAYTFIPFHLHHKSTTHAQSKPPLISLDKKKSKMLPNPNIWSHSDTQLH